MIITPDFVMLNFPKTGTTFARSVLKKIYKDKCIELLVSPIWNKHRPDNFSQHGRYFNIPREHIHKKVVSISRNPFDRYVSLYFFKWYVRFPPAEIKILKSLYPNFPEITFSEFLDMLDRFLKSDILSRYSLSDKNIGFQTIQFAEFYSLNPKESLLSLVNSSAKLKDTLPNIDFLNQENLRDELYAFLITFGIDKSLLDLLHSEPEMNVSRTSDNRNWTLFWTKELIDKYMVKEQKLLEFFPEYSKDLTSYLTIPKHNLHIPKESVHYRHSKKNFNKHIANCKNTLIACIKYALPHGLVKSIQKHKFNIINTQKSINLTNKSESKVFCISFQRTGTTSVGRFFRDHGFKWSGWEDCQKNNWGQLWYNGDYESIFSSSDFKKSNAFEDAPWFLPDFYKILYHRFPDSKFIMLTRNPDAWFQSMIKHSKGNILGRAAIHCKVYRREAEYFELLNSGKIDEQVENSIGTEKTMKLSGYDDHYKNIYNLHTIEVIDFFKKRNYNALFLGELEDPEKWIKLGKFLGVEINKDYESHENRSLI